jgi:hypothetical protein
MEGAELACLLGKRLVVFCLGRPDILGLKLAAAIDRQAAKDVNDILELRPTPEEWEFARTWAREYDGHPDWAGLVDALVRELREKLND